MSPTFHSDHSTCEHSQISNPAARGCVLSQETIRAAPASHSDVSDNALLRVAACGGALDSPGLTGWLLAIPRPDASPVTSDDTASVTEAQKAAGRDYFLLETEEDIEAEFDPEAFV